MPDKSTHRKPVVVRATEDRIAQALLARAGLPADLAPRMVSEPVAIGMIDAVGRGAPLSVAVAMLSAFALVEGDRASVRGAAEVAAAMIGWPVDGEGVDAIADLLNRETLESTRRSLAVERAELAVERKALSSARAEPAPVAPPAEYARLPVPTSVDGAVLNAVAGLAGEVSDLRATVANARKLRIVHRDDQGRINLLEDRYAVEEEHG